MNQHDSKDGEPNALAGSSPTTWYVEVHGKTGWQPLRTFGRISYYPCYEEAVAGAVREWQRSDRPTRPASVGTGAR